MADGQFIIERLGWHPMGDGFLRRPGADEAARYADRDEAEAEWREAEWEMRRRVNPFRCGGPRLFYQTHLNPAHLFDWCLELGLHPPEITDASPVWAQWWREQSRSFEPAQAAGLWDAFDRVRFYRLVDRSIGREVHLVGTPIFDEFVSLAQSSDGYPYAGCLPRFVTGRRETADGLCDELFTDQLIARGEYTGEATGHRDWLRPRGPAWSDVGAPAMLYFAPRPTDFVERVPCELYANEAVRPGQTVYVVVRLGWVLDADVWRWRRPTTASAGQPLAVFDTLAAADADVARREAEAQEELTPFRFGPALEWSTLHTSAVVGALAKLAPINFANLWNDYTATDALWCHWWDQVAPTLRDDQRAMVWALFDRLRFHEVAEAEFRP